MHTWQEQESDARLGKTVFDWKAQRTSGFFRRARSMVAASRPVTEQITAAAQRGATRSHGATGTHAATVTSDVIP